MCNPYSVLLPALQGIKQMSEHLFFVYFSVTCHVSFPLGYRFIFPYKICLQIKFWVPLMLGHKKGPLESPDLFRVGCLHSTDSELCGHAKHVNQFHHVISQRYPNFGALTFSASTKLGLQRFFN